jgi:hypothetical protein
LRALRSLADLISEPEGAAFLLDRGVHLDQESFLAELRPPRQPDLLSLLGQAGDAKLVYLGQQACADMAAATATKFAATRDLYETGIAEVAILWHDLDSTQSERFGARVVLPSGKHRRGVWLASRSLEDLEPRFIPSERERREALISFLASWVRASCRENLEAARGRVEELGEALLDDGVHTLAQANRALMTVLLRRQFGLDPPAVFASEMIGKGLLVESVTDYVERIEDVTAVFNRAVDELIAADVDPQVRRLTDDYLPLWFSCPRDGTRLRLSRRRRGGDLIAAATCRCKETYEFNFGDGRPDLGELLGTERWSIDVSMPVHHTTLASGWIGGRSSALYALAFNEVIEKVYGLDPLPVLVPAALTEPGDSLADADETLLVQYLTAARLEPGVARS